MTEQYNYDQHPDIASFRSFIRPDSVSGIHNKYLERKAAECKRLHDARDRLIESPGATFEYVPQLLYPNASDQPLFVTPYDEFEGMKVAFAPQEQVESWEGIWRYNIELANHPARIAAMRMVESRGFIPPPIINEDYQSIIDLALRKGMILQLPDIGQNADIQKSLLANDGLNELARKIRMLQGGIKNQQWQADIDVFVEWIVANSQAHRTDLLATGPFAMLGKQARSVVGLGAMPDINGSSLMLETAAKMHMIAEVPEVGFFSDPDKQAALAKQTLDRLRLDDPVLSGRSQEEKEYIVDHWRRNIVGVVEVDAEKALDRAEKLYEVGVRSFRVYGHTAGGDVVKTVRALRQTYGDDVEIFASQIADVYTAMTCEIAGADAIIIGVGSGGRCTTADLSELVPSNASLPWMLRGKLGIPVIGEGGGVDNPVAALLVGMSGVNGSGSLGGGTLETPGGAVYFKKQGNFYKPYGGEASPRTKYTSNRLYPTGDPYFAEGDQTFKQLDLREISATQKILSVWQRIILGETVLNLHAGPYVIETMHALNPSPLWEKSPTTQYLQQTH